MSVQINIVSPKLSTIKKKNQTKKKNKTKQKSNWIWDSNICKEQVNFNMHFSNFHFEIFLVNLLDMYGRIINYRGYFCLVWIHFRNQNITKWVDYALYEFN